MSSLLSLTQDDFVLKKGTRGPIMCHTIPGFSLILIYSTNCTFCHQVLPIFKKLPGTIGGCQFGILNISRNRNCIEMSKQTICPIDCVPFILLFIDGRPYTRYKGPYDFNELRRFVIEIANSLQKRQQFVQGQSQPNQQQRRMHRPPEQKDSTTLGIPVHGDNDDVCYLEFDKAYHK